MYDRVVGFLQGPEGFLQEMRHRQGIAEHSMESLRQELGELDRQDHEEQEAEARAFRLASRGRVSEAVFYQEVGLIRTRCRWIAEQRERVEAQLADLQRYHLSPESVALLRRRVAGRLAGATPQDRRFILEAVGVQVLVNEDGTWELELQVPWEAPADEQFVSTIPAKGSQTLPRLSRWPPVEFLRGLGGTFPQKVPPARYR